jgi:hypothetical protein
MDSSNFEIESKVNRSKASSAVVDRSVHASIPIRNGVIDRSTHAQDPCVGRNHLGAMATHLASGDDYECPCHLCQGIATDEDVS